MGNLLRIVGFTDSITDCDCCGKSKLKGTYCMVDDLGGKFNYGSECGARATGTTVKQLAIDVKMINTKSDIEKMANEATNDYTKSLVLKNAIKKKIDLDWFYRTFGKVSFDFPQYTGYEYPGTSTQNGTVYFISK